MSVSVADKRYQLMDATTIEPRGPTQLRDRHRTRPRRASISSDNNWVCFVEPRGAVEFSATL